MNPTREISVQRYQSEIVEAGLHRLAQPLTAALWTIEAGPHMRGGEAQIEEQVRRAIGVLRMVRNLLNAIHPYQDPQPEDLRVLVAAVRDELAASHSGTRMTLVLDDAAAARAFFVPGEAFRTALRLLIEDFLRRGFPSCAAHLTLAAEVDGWGSSSLALSIALHSPALTTLGEKEILALVRRVQPLEDSSFDFAGGSLPGAALAQAIFASIGISLEVAMHPDTLHYRLHFRPSAEADEVGTGEAAAMEVLQ